jgi:hypothetical protein
MKGGVRVNNCVPAESVEEGFDYTAKDLGNDYSGFPSNHGMKHKFLAKIKPEKRQLYKDKMNNTHNWDSLFALFKVAKARGDIIEQGVAEGKHKLAKQVKIVKGPDTGKTGWIREIKHGAFNGAPKTYYIDLEDGGQANNLPATALRLVKQQGVAEGSNGEYDDEAGMADNNLSTLRRAVEGLDDLIDTGDNLPEWCQEKIAVAKSMLVAVWDYMESADDAEEEDPELTEEFDLIESSINRIADHNGVDPEMIWEDLESLSHDELYVFAVTSQLNEDWQKANKSDRTDGMSRKAVKAYRRANPGSKLQTAVTTKPSKLKKGSKASKRRKSYCSRSKGQMNMHNISCAKTPDKAICKARRRWNC